MSSPYDPAFYAEREAGIDTSAEATLRTLFSEIYRPSSIVDFGCGLGTWLAAAHNLNVWDLRGYEGPWIEEVETTVNRTNIMLADVGSPIVCGRKFDLALCLEVAEHLHERSANALIANLTKASDIILFSAAIPNQGGADHLNEQWPSYWEKLFFQCGFFCFDILRPLIWYNQQIKFWYRQNILLFVREKSEHKLTIPAPPTAASPPMNIVHPEMLEHIIRVSATREQGPRELLKKLPRATMNRFRRAFR